MSSGQTTSAAGESTRNTPISGDDDTPPIEPPADPEDAAPEHAELEVTEPPLRQTRRWYRLAFMFTVVLVVSVVVVLPFAVGSMLDTVFGRSVDEFYDLETGRPISATEAFGGADDRTYINLTLTTLAMDTGLVTMLVSGHRECEGECPELDLLILSLDESPVRRGLAPSAELEIKEPVEVFTEQITLPVAGNPSLYPFDSYAIKLAVGGYAIAADGTRTMLTRENYRDHVEISVQDQITALVMAPPSVFDLPTATAEGGLLVPIEGQELVLTRANYLQVLTVLLVMLIGISGVLALLTRSMDDLLLGIGGLILGVWGIRSVMVPQPLPTLSIVDISLSGVILLLLIGLAVRATAYFHRHGELPSIRRRNPPSPG